MRGRGTPAFAARQAPGARAAGFETRPVDLPSGGVVDPSPLPRAQEVALEGYVAGRIRRYLPFAFNSSLSSSMNSRMSLKSR